MLVCTEVGLGPGHILLDRDPAAPHKGHSHPRDTAPNFRPMSVMAKRLLATEVGLGPSDIVLDWDPAPLPKQGA